MKNIVLLFLGFLIFHSCSNNQRSDSGDAVKSRYLDTSNRDDKISGGVKMIPIQTDCILIVLAH